MLLGVSFTVAAYLQVVRGYDAIQTGVIFTAATLGVLLTSLGAERFAKRRAQRTLIIAGFVGTIAGIGVFLAMVGSNPSVWAFAPGLFLIGLGVGLMLTPSVNVVQSSFPEEQQGEISGVSRSVSNLGSSLGTAIAGTILVAGLTTRAYGLAMAVLAGIGIVGLVAAVFLPRTPAGTTAPPATPETAQDGAGETAEAPVPRQRSGRPSPPVATTGSPSSELATGTAGRPATPDDKGPAGGDLP
jgi:MFS family permease